MHLDEYSVTEVFDVNFVQNTVTDSGVFAGGCVFANLFLGGAVAMTRNANATFLHLTFDQNSAATQGGAVYVTAQSTPEFQYCDFSYNGVSILERISVNIGRC